MEKKQSIIFEDFKIELYAYKHGKYKYKTPMYGYKSTYHYDTLAVILYKDVILDRQSFKGATRKRILARIEEFIASPKGQALIKRVDRKVKP